MLRIVYCVMAAISLGGYAATVTHGIEFDPAEREFVPADVRHSPGGYRSFHFWHSGYRGGK